MNSELTRLQKELEDILIRRRRAEHLRSLIDTIDAAQARQAPMLEELRRRLDRERADVERLEGLSFTAILWTCLGRKEARLEKERAELAAASLKYEAMVVDAEAREADRQRHLAERSRLGDVEQRYSQLIAAKELLLLQTRDENAQHLLEVVERIARLHSEIKELEEAHAAGVSAVKATDRVLKSLRKAEGWGSWDLWCGGDMLSSSIKHDHLNTAKQQAKHANSTIDRFRRELRDTRLSLSHVRSVELSGIDRFFDVFLDNFFTDWNVQSSIGRALDAVRKAQLQLNTAIAAVDSRLTITRSSLRDAQQERCRLLESVT